MKVVIDIPEILLDRIKGAKCVPDMYGSDIVNTVVCVRDATPYKERPRGEWGVDKREKVYMFVRECLNCNKRSAVGYFCMWCGADMRPKEGERKNE